MTSVTHSFYSTEQWSCWLDQLATDDFVVVDNFISDQLYEKLQQYFDHQRKHQQFAKAGIGSSDQRQVDSTVRGDFIYWLDKGRDESLPELFNLFDETTQQIKQQLFLSLSDYEFHLALYPPGTHYDKHIDQFKGKDNRVISVLIYLNENWKPGDGGELAIYKPDGTLLLVEPLAKRLILFKSNLVEHAVRQTNISRKSLTGWLLRQPASLGILAT